MFWIYSFIILSMFFCIFAKFFIFSIKLTLSIFSVILTVGFVIALLTSTVIYFLPAIFILLLGFFIGKAIGKKER
jgi:hypothetical protein